MHITNLKKVAAALTVAALTLTGCGSASVKPIPADQIPAGDIAETPRDQIKDGGTLTTAITEISEQENAFNADGTAYTTTICSWYPSLTLFSTDGKFKPNPDYLTDVKEEAKSGQTVVTYTLRDEATFNDGTPIDWKAFETTWLINNGESEDYQPSSTDGYDQIKSVTPGKNAKQAVVTFQGTYPWWQGLFGNIAHPALKQKENYDDYLNKLHPEWGAGPYTVDSADFNSGVVTFKPNPKWWGLKPKLDKRVFRQMESDAALNAFRNGEIDVVGANTRDNYATVMNLPKVDVRIGHAPHLSLLTLNSDAPVLKDKQVREAIVRGIDRDLLGKIWFKGLPYQETPPGSFLLQTFQDHYEDNFGKVAKFDAERSKQLLDQAGWKLPEGKEIREKDGQPLKVRYVITGTDALGKATSAATQKMMRNIGVDMDVETHPSSDFSRIANNHDFDLFPMGFSRGDPYGVAYTAQTYNSDSQLNRSGTGTPELDAKIKELAHIPSREGQLKRANELEPELLGTYGIVPLYNGASIVAVKRGLVNVGAPGFGQMQIEDIGWKKE